MFLFRTFKGLIILLVSGVLIVTVLAFMVFTRQEVTRVTVAAGDESARNVLQAVNLSIASQYYDLQFFRQYALDRYQQHLKNNLQIVLAAIDRFDRLAKDGTLSRPAAQQLALQYISGLRYGSNDYCFVYDSNDVAVAHPDPAIFGRKMSSVVDNNGRPVMQVLMDGIRTNNEAFCTMWWHRLGQSEPAEKMLYCAYYSNWAWKVGTGVYIDDIEADARDKMDAIMDTLKTTFAGTRVLETGYFWLFNGRREVLIRPAGAKGAPLAGAVTNLLAALVQAARQPDQPYYCQAPTPAGPGRRPAPVCIHVRYFAPLDWYTVSSVDTAEMQKPARNILWKQTLFAAILVLVFILAALWLVNRVTRPLARLTGFADQLQKNNFVLPAGADAELQAITFPQEVGRLARTIYSLEQKLQEYLKNLAESAAARERIQSELRIAHEIQMSMLPDQPPAAIASAGFDLYAALVPASAVGGDLYDYFLVGEHQFCLAVGDVSEKGVPAALFMARSKALLRALAAEGLAPDRILAKVNEELCKGNKQCMFVTVFLGLLDLQTGALTYSNAGHLPPCLLKPDGTCQPLAVIPHKPIGIMPQARYTAQQMVLAPGECCFIYTDGITEAANPQAELFGIERLLATLAQLPKTDARGTVAAVLQAVTAFAGGAPPADDIAALVIRRSDFYGVKC